MPSSTLACPSHERHSLPAVQRRAMAAAAAASSVHWQDPDYPALQSSGTGMAAGNGAAAAANGSMAGKGMSSAERDLSLSDVQRHKDELQPKGFPLQSGSDEEVGPPTPPPPPGGQD